MNRVDELLELLLLLLADVSDATGDDQQPDFSSRSWRGDGHDEPGSPILH